MRAVLRFLAACAFLTGTASLAPCQDNMVFVKGGTFTMGSSPSEANRMPDEKRHQVTVSSFYLSRYEVTFDEFDAYVAANGWGKLGDAGWGRGKRPVINVAWIDAVQYCNWRSKKEGLQQCYTSTDGGYTCDWNANGYRLPTEAEWEYACRAGTTTATAYGDSLGSSQANLDGTYPYNGAARGIALGKTQTVGSYAPNAWGLYDMHGNVWEWCWDWYGDYATAGFTVNPRGNLQGDMHVLRGGSWADGALDCRSSARGIGYQYNDSHQDIGDQSTGFRLARSFR
jgi:formylglycine-generating enzyme